LLIAKTNLMNSSWSRAFVSGPAYTGSYPASRFSCSTATRASSSPHHKLLGLTLALPSSPYNAAKLMLNDFAMGPLVFDLMNSAFDGKPDGGSTPKRFVASITV